MPIGGKTTIIPRGQAQSSGGKAHLVAPRDLDFGQLRHGEVARSKLRVANNGAGLLTGTARIGPDTPWLRILGTGSVYCAAGAVEALEVQVDTDGLRPGKHTGTVLLDTDGGQATVQVGVAVFRESMAPAILAAVVTALAVLAISGLVYANNGGRLPFVAVATRTPLPTATPVPTATHMPTATHVPSATAVPTTPAPTATVVNSGATATAEARQAQQLVASAAGTATALAGNSNSTATAVAIAGANQAPGAAAERLTIQQAVNNFLLVRKKALATGDVSALATVATDKELTSLQEQIANLKAAGQSTQIVSLTEPVWDSIVIYGSDRADATLSKYEDELRIRDATGRADDRDPSYTGERHTVRNTRFGVTYQMVLRDGRWLVAGHTVYDLPTPLPTPQPALLPPPNAAPIVANGTATDVPTVAPSGGLSIQDVVKEALPSVLRVTGTLANSQQSTGTGFVIKTSGGFAYVVTNDHVVNGASNIMLSDQHGNQLPEIAVQEDSADDLAVLKIAQPAQPLVPLAWGNSESAQLGENVVAIGFALGLTGEPSISSGILAALHRDVGQRWLYLQHTAPINHGNSGGPLLDLQGTVIGINTLLDENAQSVYFAIPAAKAQQKINDLIGGL